MTANGVVFTGKLVIKDKQISGNHKFDKLYSLGEMKYHLTQLATSKTNDTVKQANGIIKNTTVKVIIYQTIGEMKHDLAKFLLFYHYAHPHEEVRKEVKVRTPYKALEYWYNLKPDLFIREPCMFQEMVFEKR